MDSSRGGQGLRSLDGVSLVGGSRTKARLCVGDSAGLSGVANRDLPFVAKERPQTRRTGGTAAGGLVGCKKKGGSKDPPRGIL